MVDKKDKNDPISVYNMMQGLEYNREKFSQALNNTMIASILYRYAVNRIKWSGLPPRVSPVLLEQLMIEGHLPCLYQPEWASEPLLHIATPNGQLDNQRLSTHYQIRTVNNLHYKIVRRREIALLDPRYLRLNVPSTIVYYADLFEEFDKALKSNLRVQKTPVIVFAKRSQRMTAQNVAQAYENGEPMIFTYEDANLGEALQAVNFNVDYVGRDILVDRRAAWNDVMTWLGIDNVNQDKRERLVTDEVAGNSEQIEMSRFVELNPRRAFAQDVFEKFGYAVSCVWNHDFQTNNYILEHDNTVDTGQDDIPASGTVVSSEGGANE